MPLIAHWTSKDLEALPQLEGVRYEIIDGELYVSTAPSWQHQYTCGVLFAALHTWSLTSGMGTAVPAPGVIFAPDQDVIPDVVWVSHRRLQGALDQAGHLTRAPELVVEVTSPGSTNSRRDREEKLALYSPASRRRILDRRSTRPDDRRLPAGRGTLGACRWAHRDRHADLAALARLQLPGLDALSRAVRRPPCLSHATPPPVHGARRRRPGSQRRRPACPGPCAWSCWSVVSAS